MRFKILLSTTLLLASIGASHAILERGDGRFDHLVRTRDGGVIGIKPTPLSSLPTDDPLRLQWTRVAAEQGGEWRIWLDERSALPTLVLIRGKRWDVGGEPGVETYAARAHELLRDRLPISQFVLDGAASGPRGPHVWQVRFVQVVDGVRVEGATFDVHVSHGNLVSIGAERWAPVRIPTTPDLSAQQARALLDDYVRPTPEDGLLDLGEPQLLLLPLDADPGTKGAWRGPSGLGIKHRLIWRFRFADAEGVATWTAEIDAHSGEIAAFYDDTRYDRIEGHVNPISDDGLCADGGCPEPGWPMPFADYTEDGGAVQYADQHGLYSCVSPGSTIETTLSGKYFRIDDQCGSISETTVCDNELDLGVADDVNCGVAAGASAGNTDAARSAYYSLSLVNRKARFWVSGNAWLDSTQVLCRTNTGGSCNASWGGGTINMNTGSTECGNTGQLQGLVTHEWGHGFDQNDGGGFDNPSEAYSDIIAVLEGRESCIARGFKRAENCSGYGDTCLDCTGLREMDWDARQSHAPATPTGFLSGFCPGGGGPCGKEVHCESHLASEAIYDLAVRDLPAMGIDADTAWQLTERLWYQSRPASGGDAYNCTIPDSDSCSVGSWYHQLRVQDDDDGNLSNGTPHAAAIFAAFDRHAIACGGSGDPENQNTSSCPALDAPVVGFTAQTNAVDVDWDPVPGAGTYRVYRNEIGCHVAQFPVAEVADPTTDFLDVGLANGLPLYYRVQAIGANAACESPVSTCVEAAAQQLAGRVRFDRTTYSCSDSIQLEVTDLNHPGSSMTVTLHSDTETTPETVTLDETSPGSARFTGTILTTSAPVAADGLISIADGDTLTAEYIDLDDGEGGTNVAQQTVAFGDCLGPIHTSIAVGNLTDSSAAIDWTTSETTTAIVEWGTTPALGNVISSDLPAAAHGVTVGPFTACQRLYFRITSTDGAGNTTVADVQGAPFEFNASTIQGILHLDDFETDSGWTMESDWEIGSPQGLGSPPGDPVAASQGSQVLGQDLSGQGSNPGDYERNTTRSATSPSIDVSSLSDVELRFDRWLNYDSSANAYIEIKDASGVWQNVWFGTGGLTAAAWSQPSYDVTAFAAGNADVQIRFTQFTRFAIAAGWNIDRLTLRDGSQPLHGACGGCVGAPTFAGVVSATDVDPCADSGIEVAWSPAPAWGSGGSGTYSVYRDTTSGFTPSAGNRLVSGIAGTSWVDATAPADVVLYYVVRAENDETCGGGPNNNGLIDGNLVYATGENTVGGPGAGPVGDTLLVDPAQGTDVRLSWDAVSGATSYDVSRSAAPDAGFAVVGQSASPSYDDTDALTDGQTWFYKVTTTSTCGESAE